MSVFRFQKFSVRNERSAMKVNTDGVLLGALMTINGDSRHLLDIGTGTGTIALMAAQRMDQAISGTSDATESPYIIEGIDIDAPSAEEAAMNFESSPWKRHLRAHNLSLSEFSSLCGSTVYDHIFTNPPFFLEDLHSPDSRKAATRHADSLPLEEILDFASQRLTPSGHLSLILPFDSKIMAVRLAAEKSLHLFSCVDIRSTERKQPHRSILEFSRCRPA
ncbi:MAG: methyltransferase, partial [Candidatus Cryptobacteroides sp.]|nr:methyltransferase [Candidatus Cryptobacteroides sp.]